MCVMMQKRIIAVFTVFCLSIGCLCLRLYVLGSSGTELVSSDSHYSSFTLYNIRGDITDCNGKKIVGSQYDNYVIAKPSVQSLSALSDILDTRTYQSARERMSKGAPVMLNIGKSEIEPNDNLLCVPVCKRYSTNQPAQHLVGYLDELNHGVAGIEKAFDDILCSDGFVKARVPVDVYGKAIGGSSTEIISDMTSVGSVRLTIDLDIQSAVEDALDTGGINEGCAIVVEVKSGAVRAMASRPVYTASRISDSLTSDSSPFLNRCLSGLAVGSIFKVAVAAAAIENGLEDFQCECKGSCRIGNVAFGCSSNAAHGKVDLKKALEVSCNTYFISLGQRLGAEPLLETASILGFGQKNDFADGIAGESGILPRSDELVNPAALANFSFGQGCFTATPVQIAQMLCAVAGNGKYYSPYIVESATGRDGKVTEYSNRYPTVAMSERTSRLLLEMLTSVVENGNASPAKPTRFTAAGKTATAQTGIYGKDGIELCNTWFGGCFPAENPRYAVVVMKQGGISGSYDCAPIFKAIADKIFFTE